jgi:hypothetical protein
MMWVYEGTYFGHVMPKAGQHTTNDDKVFMGPTLVSVNMFWLDCKRLLHGQRNIKKGCRSKRRHTWIVGYNFKS